MVRKEGDCGLEPSEKARQGVQVWARGLVQNGSHRKRLEKRESKMTVSL